MAFWDYFAQTPNTSGSVFYGPQPYQKVEAGAPVYTQQQATSTPPSNYNIPKPPTGYTTSTGEIYGSVNTGGGTTQKTSASEPTPTNSGPSAEELYRQNQESLINSGWDSYTNQLNDILNNELPTQQTAQQQMAQTSYNQGLNELGTQRTQGEEAVAKSQATNLKDLGENVKNLFQAGNIYLGSRGAGDSSAANQYSYAIGKIGTKARADIMSQANDRLNQIGNIYNSEKNRLSSEFQNQMSQIANWFSSAQMQLKQQLGQAGLGRSQDLQALSTNLYNQALTAMQNIQSQTAQKQSALDSWVSDNSKSVQSAIQNLQASSQLPQYQGIQTGTPQITQEGMYVPIGYGATTEKKFNPITGLYA